MPFRLAHSTTNRTSANSGIDNRYRNAWLTSKDCVESTMEISLLPDFKGFLKLLNEREVEYLLVGGYAVGYYGYPRATIRIRTRR